MVKILNLENSVYSILISTFLGREQLNLFSANRMQSLLSFAIIKYHDFLGDKRQKFLIVVTFKNLFILG